MATILHIAGHGKNKDGTFDPGATGLIKQGEHRYYAQSFFNYLKKYEPKGHKVIYHIAYNVYDYGDIVSLARKYGNDTIVIEWHFDATGTPNAHGGHVIVYSGFAPDELDLRLRDGIKDMVGVRYNHRGHTGISGRNNLANVNRSANSGINYRLVELGFGTSPKDSKVMLGEMDRFAKVMSESIYNTEIKAAQQQDSMAGYHVVKSGDTLWAVAQQYGVTVANLKGWNDLDSDLIFPGQSLEVRGADLPLPKPEPKPSTPPPVAKSSNKVKIGDWVRVPANKLYAKGGDSKPVKSKAHSGKVETINNSWKNQIRLLNSDGSYLGFARISDFTGGHTDTVKKQGYNVTADGYLGPETVKALQRYFGLVVDGEMWGQYSGNQATKAFNQKAVKYGKGGSPVVKALQKKIGATADGIWGAGTTRALQKYLGTPVDGVISRPSTAIKKLQQKLKDGTF